MTTLFRHANQAGAFVTAVFEEVHKEQQARLEDSRSRSRLRFWILEQPQSVLSLNHSKLLILSAKQGDFKWQIFRRSAAAAAAHHQHGQLQSPSWVLLLVRLFQLWKLCVLTSTPCPPPTQHYWLISWTDRTRISPSDCCSRRLRVALQRRWRCVSRVSAAEAQLQFETPCFFCGTS